MCKYCNHKIGYHFLKDEKCWDHWLNDENRTEFCGCPGYESVEEEIESKEKPSRLHFLLKRIKSIF